MRDLTECIRRRYLEFLAQLTGRNVIACYSQVASVSRASADAESTGFNGRALASMLDAMDPSKGLDLVIHTLASPQVSALPFVKRLRQRFGRDVRAIVPDLAMSAGAMVVCACSEVIMGDRAALGPIDLGSGGVPTYTEFYEHEGSYSAPRNGLIQWSRRVVEQWLVSGMLADQVNADAKAKTIVNAFSAMTPASTYSRRMGRSACRGLQMNITDLEADDQLHLLVSTLHGKYMESLRGNLQLSGLIESDQSCATISPT